MRGRIGIGVGHDRVRAVFVRGGAIVWAAETTRDPGASLAASIEAILARAPSSRWRRTPVNVAVGACAAQVKLLAGLPAVDDTRALAAVVREGAASFFLRNGSDLITTGVHPAGEGQVWAAAIESATVEAIREACRGRGVKLRSLAPAAVLLPLVARNYRFTWRDGPVALEIGRSGSTLEAVRRVPATLVPPGEPPLDPIEPLASLGSEGSRYSDAYAATLVDANSPLALGSDGLRPLSESTPKRRLALPAAVGCIGLLAFALSPLGSERAAYRARARLDEGRATEAWRTIVASVDRLERITAVLDEIDVFVGSRPERTRLLGDLARVLPDRSAIVRLEIDGSEGTLVVVTPRTAALLASLRSLASLSSVDVVGQVARQHMGGRDLERVAVRFRIQDVPPVAPDSATSDENP